MSGNLRLSHAYEQINNCSPPEVIAYIPNQLPNVERVLAVAAGLSDVGAIRGALPCSSGCHGCKDDGGGHVPRDQVLIYACINTLDCTHTCYVSSKSAMPLSV